MSFKRARPNAHPRAVIGFRAPIPIRLEGRRDNARACGASNPPSSLEGDGGVEVRHIGRLNVERLDQAAPNQSLRDIAAGRSSTQPRTEKIGMSASSHSRPGEPWSTGKRAAVQVCRQPYSRPCARHSRSCEYGPGRSCSTRARRGGRRGAPWSRLRLGPRTRGSGR